jgi:hypothetical protein
MNFMKTWLVLVMLGVLWPQLAEASVRDRVLQRRAATARAAMAAPTAVTDPAERHEASQPSPTWSMTPELYPQWYGGFHGRMLQNYGYPAGDIGIRGQAW